MMQAAALGCGAPVPLRKNALQSLRVPCSTGLLATRPLPLVRRAAPKQQQHLRAVAKAAPSTDEAAVRQQQLEEQQRQLEEQRLARKAQRDAEQAAYKAAAVAASVLIISVATLATCSRILWHLQDAGEFPYLDLACTLLLVAGGMVGMEMYARYAHARWHDVPLLWRLHASHHEPRLGAFEKNDLYAVINALPAMALCAYGFLTPSLTGAMCFGAGLGITLFGISYVFVHDGMVHRRFPVGPLADTPYFRRVTLAHQLHHSEKYGGVPFGLFLGPQELEAVGGGADLDRMVAELGKADKKKNKDRAAA